MMARLSKSKIVSTHSRQRRLYLQVRCPYLVLGADPWAPVRHGSVWAVTGTKQFAVQGVSQRFGLVGVGGQWVQICTVRGFRKNCREFQCDFFCLKSSQYVCGKYDLGQVKMCRMHHQQSPTLKRFHWIIDDLY